VPSLSEEHVIAPEASAWEALLRLSSGQCGRLLVLEGGALRGILSRTDIMRAMRIRLGLGT
jgi:CBS domain-containing protein